MSFVLTRPIQTLTAIPGTQLTNVPVPNNTVTTVDSILKSNNLTAKWIVTITDPTNNRMNVSEVLATWDSGSNTATHRRFAFIGNRFPHRVDVTDDVTTVNLEVNNLTSDDFLVTITRIQSGITP